MKTEIWRGTVVVGAIAALGALLVALVGGCASAPQAERGAQKGAAADLGVVAEFPHQQVTGVAVSRTGRTFVNFPYWSDGHTLSVAEIGSGGGLQPYPDGWRAKVRAPETLPHHPMVLHRGGFPDGS